MVARWPLVLVALAGVAQLPPKPTVSQNTAPVATHAPRTIPYHDREVVTLRAKVRFTTTIVLPAGEEILEATCGDKEFWIVNAHGGQAFIKPAKPASETNLNLLAASGRIYAFLLTEISEVKGADPDLVVYLEPDAPDAFAPWHEPPKYVPASQLDDVKTQAEIAREDARRATAAAESRLEEGLTAFRMAYPLSLQFAYRVDLDRAPFFVRGMFHDGHVTYIQARAPELPALYELKDGAPNLVNFEVHDGTYVIPKVLDGGYLAIGNKRLPFTRIDAR
jgi:hypothetical protein